jgi:hypothetical protein
VKKRLLRLPPLRHLQRRSSLKAVMGKVPEIARSLPGMDDRESRLKGKDGAAVTAGTGTVGDSGVTVVKTVAVERSAG